MRIVLLSDLDILPRPLVQESRQEGTYIVDDQAQEPKRVDPDPVRWWREWWWGSGGGNIASISVQYGPIYICKVEIEYVLRVLLNILD